MVLNTYFLLNLINRNYSQSFEMHSTLIEIISVGLLNIYFRYKSRGIW